MPDFAHRVYNEIQFRLLEGATAALKQANHHSVFFDPGNEHWQRMSILNAAHAGELFIKAAIASVHPLLIFQNIFEFDANTGELSLEDMIKHGKSHDFAKLPKILWATTGRRISNLSTFKRIQESRNAIQHFVHLDVENLGDLSLKFIYEVIDPLMKEEFGLFAIEYHEDHLIGYDYIVDAVVKSGLKFSIPNNFDITEIRLWDSYKDQDSSYKAWLEKQLEAIGKRALLDKPKLKSVD